MKQLKTEDDITGEIALAMRQEKGMTQAQFWGPLGVSQNNGCRFETGQTGISMQIRRLFFAHYVMGLEIDASTPEGVRELKRLARLQKEQPAR